MTKVHGDPFLLNPVKRPDDPQDRMGDKRPAERPPLKRSFRDVEFLKLTKD